MGDRGLHHLGTLQHLGDDQLVGVEQPSDLGHPGHQRTVDDVQRLRPALVGKGEVDVVDRPSFEPSTTAAGETLLQRQLGPRLRTVTTPLRPRK